MAYYRTVNKLTFDLYELYGVYLPDDSMIRDVLADRLTDEAKRQFCETSNHYCSIFKGQISNELPPDIPENKLTTERIELNREFIRTKQSMSAIAGYDYVQLDFSQCVINWYQAVAGNFSGGNPQSIRKGNIPYDVNPINGEMVRDSPLFKYLNFKQAVDYICGFYDSISSLYGEGNLEVINLSNKQDELFKRMASLEEKIRRQSTKEFIFFCKYCQSYHTYNSFKVRETCGSKDCDLKADNARKLIDRKGWVEEPGAKPKVCVMGGSRRVKLNSHRLCLQCYLELGNCIENYLV